MNTELRLRFRRGDFFAIILVALLAAATLLFFLPEDADANAVAQVYQDGRLLKELPLDTDSHLEIGGDYRNVIAVENGRIAIVESDCPGADCVHSGWIDRPGRSIVCLPNRVEIRISGASDVDFVVG